MSFPLILTLVATLAVLAATFVLVALLRRLRPHDPLSGDDDSLSASVDSQLREMTERIEATVTQQQEQDETQRQRLAQQIDGVQQGVGEQRVLLDNLRSEVRHESKRRDHELDEIRDQIASIHNALPTLGAAPEGEALALPPASEASAPADPFVSETQDLVDSARSTDAAPDWAEVAWEVDAGSIASDAPAGADPATALDNDAIFTFEDAFVDASFEDVTADAEEAVTPEAPTPEAIAPEALASEAIAEEAPDEPTDVPAPFDTEPEAAPADVVAEAPAPPPAFDAPAFVGLAVAEPTPSPEMPIDELASPDLPSAPDAAAPNVWGVQPDAPGEAEGPAEAVFEELTLAEMSIEEFAFADFALEIDAEDDGAPGDVQMGAFDADPFTIEEAADPFVVTDEASETAPLPQEGSPEPDAALTSPEPTPASPQAEPDASAQSDAAEPPSAPTAFVGDPLPAADPLAFEEAFVPTPIVDAAPEPTEMGDDLFAAWSPTETPEPAPEPLAFVEAPAPPPGDHAADPEAAPAAAPADASSTGLSAFEDWGLDPVPVAAPASDAAWTAPETAPDASETWVPSQTTPPPPPPHASPGSRAAERDGLGRPQRVDPADAPAGRPACGSGRRRAIRGDRSGRRPRRAGVRVRAPARPGGAARGRGRRLRDVPRRALQLARSGASHHSGSGRSGSGRARRGRACRGAPRRVRRLRGGRGALHGPPVDRRGHRAGAPPRGRHVARRDGALGPHRGSPDRERGRRVGRHGAQPLGLRGPDGPLRALHSANGRLAPRRLCPTRPLSFGQRARF